MDECFPREEGQAFARGKSFSVPDFPLHLNSALGRIVNDEAFALWTFAFLVFASWIWLSLLHSGARLLHFGQSAKLPDIPDRWPSHRVQTSLAGEPRHRCVCGAYVVI